MPDDWNIRQLSCLLLLPLLAAFQAPSPAPDEGAQRVVPRITPTCSSAPEGEEIVVCGSRDVRSPYRLPVGEDGFDWRGSVASVSRERNALLEGGESGIGSCGTTGPGGASGCFALGVRHRIEQKAGSKRSGGGLEF